MSQNSVTELFDGQLQSASVQRDGWIFFYFLLGSEHTAMTLSAKTAVGGGDIALFVSEHPGAIKSAYELELPNATSYDFKTTLGGAPSLMLPEEDTVPGATYTVGVHGTTAIEQAETIAFTISLATDR